MKTFSRVAAWAAIAIAAIVNAAGYLFNLYRFAGFDKVLHGYTLFAITFVVAYFCDDRVLTGQRKHPVLLFLAVTLIGVGIGGVWEVLEWWYDMTTAANTIRGKYDTMFDLVVDTAGAALAAVAHILRGRRTPEPVI